jgi:hypothetical protein
VTTEVIDGGAPALASEPANPGAAQPNAATTDPATGAGEGGEGGQVTPKTYSEQEHRDAIERATAKAAAKAERRAYREALAQLSPQAPQQQAAQQDDGKPTRAQFQHEDAYFEAMLDWRLGQRDREAAAQQRQQQARTTSERISGLYAQAEKLPGFDREAYDDLPLTAPIVKALIDADKPEKLMLFLQQNPAEVERIGKLPDFRQAAELGKLEAKVSAAPPKTSNAPDPINPIGNGKTPIQSLDTDDMDQYMAQRKKQGAVWAR